EIEDTAIDHGIVPNSAESARATANRIAKRAHLDPDDRARLRGVVMAAEREWYGGSPSVSAHSPSLPAHSPSLPARTSSAPVRSQSALAQPALQDPSGTDIIARDLAEERETANTTSNGAPLTRQRPAPERGNQADLAAAALSVISGLREHAKTRLSDRIVPRSLRHSARP
ncbi:MAG: hypothetical protein ACR2M5_14165, partial [Nakamurella sp.]